MSETAYVISLSMNDTLKPLEVRAGSHLPNKNTFKILSLVYVLQSKLKGAPNRAAIQKHQTGNLNPALLGLHLDELKAVNYLLCENVGKRVLFQLTEQGRIFIENLPEKWSGLQETKKRLMF
jgi:hypothetical protein